MKPTYTSKLFYKSNKDKTLGNLCPIYAKALVTAGLMKGNKFLILRNCIALAANTNINLLCLLDEDNDSLTDESIKFN